VLVHRPDICLEDDLVRRGGTAHLREPVQGGRPPGGLARRAAVMPQQTRVEPECGGFERPDGIFASPAQVADGFVFDLGNSDGREVPRAQEPRPWDGVTPVGCDPVARLLRHPGGGDDPARMPSFVQSR
jgi:hypothetical protein